MIERQNYNANTNSEYHKALFRELGIMIVVRSIAEGVLPGLGKVRYWA